MNLMIEIYVDSLPDCCLYCNFGSVNGMSGTCYAKDVHAENREISFNDLFVERNKNCPLLLKEDDNNESITSD